MGQTCSLLGSKSGVCDGRVGLKVGRVMLREMDMKLGVGDGRDCHRSGT